MEALGLFILIKTPTIFQLIDRLIVKPEEILEDMVISIKLWVYPTNFMVLQPKSTLGEYTLILGQSWLAIVGTYIGHESRNNTISHGTSNKQITLYPLSKPSIDHGIPFWYNEEGSDEDKVFH